MAQCSSCGSGETEFSRQVECVWVHKYNLNEPGSPTRRDVIAKKDWDIGLCRNCVEKRFEESLRFSRRLGLFIGPGLLVGSVLSALILFPILAKVRSPLASMSALLFCGGAFVVGLIMVPVGLFKATKESGRLRRLKQEGAEYEFGDEDVWEAIETEGERIIKCLESGKGSFHGSFALPQAKRPDERMGSLFYYTIRKKETVQ